MQFFARLSHSESPDAIQRFVEVLRTNKVIHYTDVARDINHRDFYRQLALSAGKFVKRDEDYKSGDQGETQDDWMDIRFVDDLKAASFRHSDTRQPIHTDGAYLNYHFDISFFFCTVQAEVGGATTFIDGAQVIDLLRRYEPLLLSELESAAVIFDKGEQQRKVQHVVRYDEQGPLLNWNHFRISKDNPADVVQMCHRFFEFTEKKIFEAGLLMPLLLQPGEAVLFHDERVLHGRNSFLGERCLIKGGIDL
jgi:alpha-ketoglutarate-dependent taurine dioxygenase